MYYLRKVFDYRCFVSLIADYYIYSQLYKDACISFLINYITSVIMLLLKENQFKLKNHFHSKYLFQE